MLQVEMPPWPYWLDVGVQHHLFLPMFAEHGALSCLDSKYILIAANLWKTTLFQKSVLISKPRIFF